MAAGDKARSFPLLPQMTDHRAKPMLRNAAIISAVLTLSACLCLTARAAPYTPVNDAQALETLPSASNATLRALRQLHAELARQPDNLPLALQAAQQANNSVCFRDWLA